MKAKIASLPKERAVIYHGLKILPIFGKRSLVAEVIRQAVKDIYNCASHCD